jgi:ATP-binding cassette subfamily B protein
MTSPPSPQGSAADGEAQASLQAIADRVGSFEPFDRLAQAELLELAAAMDRRRYRIGQTVLREDVLPEGLLFILSGRLRMLAASPGGGGGSVTIDRLGAGSLAGWPGLVRGRPCEHLRASTEVEALQLPAAALLDCLVRHPQLAAWFHGQLSAGELHQLLRSLSNLDPQVAPLLEQWSSSELEVELISLPMGKTPGNDDLNPAKRWMISSGGPLAQPWSAGVGAGEPDSEAFVPWLRLIGLPLAQAAPVPAELSPKPDVALVPQEGEATAALATTEGLPPPTLADSAGSYSLSPEPPASPAVPSGGKPGVLSLPRATGPRGVPLALSMALARYFGLPLNRDGVLDFIDGTLRRQPRLNLMNAGQLFDYLGLRVIFTHIPTDRLARVPCPAILEQHGQLVLLDGVDPDGRVRVLEPELGPLRVPLEDLELASDGMLPMLLVERKPDSKVAHFGWGWFMPYLRPHRRELVEVLAASLVVNVLALATPLGMQVLIDQVARNQNVGALISVSALLLLSSVATAVVRTLRSFVFTQVTNRVDQESKASILDHMVRLPQGFFDSRPVGQVTYYFSMLDRLREFLIGQSLTTIVDFLFSILYIFILLAINPLLTLITLSTIPLMVILAILGNPIFEDQIKRSLNEAVSTYSYLTEAITGIQTIKSQNAELKTRWEFSNRYARYVGEDFKLRITSESLANIANFLSDLNSLLVIGFGIWLVMQNQITIGGFIAFRIISGYITRPMVQLAQTWQQFRVNTRQLQMVGDVVDRVPEQTEEEATNLPMPPIRGDVRLDEVTFRFTEQSPLVLHGISLEIPAGSFVGMVGGSGSGKSTVLKLLPRFYRPLSGKVLIDGFDVSKVELYSLRRQVGVVPQDSLLFDGTIRENLMLVKPDASADELIRAAKIACAHDFIMDMPQGYNSSVGERGAGLSGGQRQRLALARAVLQNPRMLILDEATSALDARTERQVCINLFEAFRGRTVFFITHRLTTVRPADVIVLMDRGAVMEVGSHGALMQHRGWYYALYQSQNQEGLS